MALISDLVEDVNPQWEGMLELDINTCYALYSGVDIYRIEDPETGNEIVTFYARIGKQIIGQERGYVELLFNIVFNLEDSKLNILLDYRTPFFSQTTAELDQLICQYFQLKCVYQYLEYELLNFEEDSNVRISTEFFTKKFTDTHDVVITSFADSGTKTYLSCSAYKTPFKIEPAWIEKLVVNLNSEGVVLGSLISALSHFGDKTAIQINNLSRQLKNL